MHGVGYDNSCRAYNEYVSEFFVDIYDDNDTTFCDEQKCDISHRVDIALLCDSCFVGEMLLRMLGKSSGKSHGQTVMGILKKKRNFYGLIKQQKIFVFYALLSP